MNIAYLLTGGNLGNRLNNINTAKVNIEKLCGNIVSASSIYETAAWGIKDQPNFYNQALQIQTNLSSQQLLQNIHIVEQEMGRVRNIKYAARTIDIDILLFSNSIVHTETLIIPHPFLHERRFALTPLAEIAEKFIHPVFNKTIQQLLQECSDDCGVYKIS